jgi:hypothetical protein
MSLGLTQPHTEWVQEAVSPGVKRQGHEANHLPPPKAEVKNGGVIPRLPHMPSRIGD